MNRIDVTKFLESKYPKTLAYEWDNVGLQVGTLNKPVKTVLITLDVTKEVVKEAILVKADMILSHHPLIFQPVANIQFDTPRGWIIQQLVKHDIALYSLHTNFDLADGGMNDHLAKMLGLKDLKLLDEEAGIGRFGDIDPVAIKEFVAFVKNRLDVDSVRLIGNSEKIVRTVGISGGSGQQHMYQAKKHGCDVYLTGDVTYHNALDAYEMGFTVIDIGHHAEKVFVQVLYDDLSGKFPEVMFRISQVDTNPFQTI